MGERRSRQRPRRLESTARRESRQRSFERNRQTACALTAGRIARAVAVAAVLTGCASLSPPAPESDSVDRAALAAPFNAEGRLSARRGNDGVAGQFSWRHESAHDTIDLT